MWLSLPKTKLSVYLREQLAHAFPDGRGPGARTSTRVVSDALDAAEHCFTRIAVKYFSRQGKSAFNHLNSDQYAMFLYWVSRFAFERGDEVFAEKAYCLNKMMHGVDVFYEVQLPNVFFFCHVTGAVLGKALYDEYLSVFQGVTVGGNHGIYPSLGKYVTLLGGCTVIGKCQIGTNTIIGAHTMIKDRDVADHRIVMGAETGIVEIPNNNERYLAIFHGRRRNARAL
nr:serine acetyltransferase [Nitrospirota bacterium]